MNICIDIKTNCKKIFKTKGKFCTADIEVTTDVAGGGAVPTVEGKTLVFGSTTVTVDNNTITV